MPSSRRSQPAPKGRSSKRRSSKSKKQRGAKTIDWERSSANLQKNVEKAAAEAAGEPTGVAEEPTSPSHSANSVMEQEAAERSKAVEKSIQGLNDNYELRPEDAIRHLNEIELNSTVRSIHLGVASRRRLAQELLESTTRIRRTHDSIVKLVNDKETELGRVQEQLMQAQAQSENKYLGLRGENRLNKTITKTSKKLAKATGKCKQIEHYGKILARMKSHLQKALLRLRKSSSLFERELRSLDRSEVQARRKRLEVYQSLAREKRNHELIAEKVGKIRHVQSRKLKEAETFVQQQVQRHAEEVQKQEARRASIAQALEARSKKVAQQTAAQHLVTITRQDAVAEQLAPLADVFYKIRVRTGRTNFTADQIAELYIGQSQARDVLHQSAREAMDKRERLQTRLDERRNILRAMEEGSDDHSSNKSFYSELDKLEKLLHIVRSRAQREVERRNRLEVTIESAKTFIRQGGRSLQGIHVMDEEVPFSSIEHHLSRKDFASALKEMARIVGALAQKTAVDQQLQQTEVASAHQKKGTLAPNMSMGSLNSPGNSLLDYSVLKQPESQSNIRVSRRISSIENGYDSDPEPAEGSPVKVAAESKGGDDERQKCNVVRRQMKQVMSMVMKRGRKSGIGLDKLLQSRKKRGSRFDLDDDEDEEQESSADALTRTLKPRRPAGRKRRSSVHGRRKRRSSIRTTRGSKANSPRGAALVSTY